MSEKAPRPRKSKAKKNTFITRSGKSIKINRSFKDRLQAAKDAKAKRKAEFLSNMPKETWKQVLYRLNPKRHFKYWFSREGALMALKVTGVAFVVGFLIIVGVFAYFRKDLPRINDISGNNFGGSITYYDRTGKTILFQDYTDRKRIPVEGDKISQYMRDATVAVEDKNFYEHGAFDTRGIMRAAWRDVTNAGGPVEGGSTITQQLVKINEGWTDDRTIARKIKELILAVELEREYSKDQILTGYLNMAPYGGVDYGVEAAAQDYFATTAEKLTLAQAAMLAAIPKAPGSLSPYNSPVYNKDVATNYFDSIGLIQRQHYILELMAEQGYVTKEEAEAAKEVDILAQVQPIKSHFSNIKAPYFVLAARAELRELFKSAPVDYGGWKVITSLNMELQTLAEKAVADGKAQMDRQKADSVAFVAEDNETGQIVALIGGSNFKNEEYGQINYATDVNISPGSTIKVYDYVSFIDNNKNVGAGSILYDTVGPLPGYPCTRNGSSGNCLNNFDFKSPGPTTLRYALGGSRNIPAVKAFLSAVPDDKSSLKTTSINKVISTINGLMSKDDGYRCYVPGTDVTRATKADQTQCYAAAGIGDGAYLHLDDHVNGIASVARLGEAIPQTTIMKVENSSGKTLYEYEQPEAERVVKADSAYIVSDMGSDPGASYLSGSCNSTNCFGSKFHRYKGWKIGIKTGTTNDKYDGLMVSWNTKYSAAIWVGNHTRTVAYTGQPEYMTGPIMSQFMKGAIDNLGNVPAQNWQKPEGVKTLPAYVMRSTAYASQTRPSPSTDLFPSWYTDNSSEARSQEIDKVSGLLATSCTPRSAIEKQSNSNVAKWNVDIFKGGSTSVSDTTTQETDNVHNCNDSPPDVQITSVNVGGSPVLDKGTYTCPLEGCTIIAYVTQGTHALSDTTYPDFPGTVSLLVNGTSVQSQGISSTGQVTFNYVPKSSGDITVSVKVSDSVLYEGTDSVDATVPKNNGGGNDEEGGEVNGVSTNNGGG